MNVLKLLLYPFAAMYNGAMRIRNHLYDIGQKPSFAFDTAVVAVGNLNVGGSGKTPMVEYLVELLCKRFPTVMLSRGYKRETTGYRMAGSQDTARTIGDEPLQVLRKFGTSIHVAVGEDRVYAIPNILAEFPETRAVILDDALQQRSIRPNLSILLTSYNRPFFSDYLLPFGRLRESRSGASRADVVVVTKCPVDISVQTQQDFIDRIHRHADGKPVFFTSIEYSKPLAARPGQTLGESVVLVTGIANSEQVKSFCSSRHKLIHHFSFADHHRYTQSDLDQIDRFCQNQAAKVSLLTTEKDMAKLDCPEFAGFLDRLPWFTLPIRQVFLKDGSKFDEMVLDAVERAPQT